MSVEELMIRLVEGAASARLTILRRRPMEETAAPPQVQARLDAMFGAGTTPAAAVLKILADVQARGDAALHEFTLRIDGADLPNPEVPPEALAAAYRDLEPGLRQALETAAERLRAFHQREQHPSWLHWEGGGALGQMVRPLRRVGLYVPGGTASYPSSVLHTAVPAGVAGVEEIVVATPPARDGSISPVILAACHIAGVHRVYRMGGAQAIAALAFGTQTIARVDKILGPGNIFVALAKRAVAGSVGIDQIAGPTETVVIADESANPILVAADLLAQAEHDPMASAILITPSLELARQVQEQVALQLTGLSRRAIATASLTTNGGIAVVETLGEALELANEYAPEHLCLAVHDPWNWLPRVRGAGGVFLGDGMSEALGDYAVGPSHVMPTGGTARFASPLHVGDFLKVTSIFGLGPDLVARLTPPAAALAAAEGLTAHVAAMNKRII
jgi:histidinol dehydrogenase